MEEKILTVSKTARVITAGDESASIAVVALHGYAQLSTRFFENIKAISNVYWVVPEALNRFYVEGFSGNIGASWMTKELREADILDNMNYLNEVFSQFIQEKGFDKVVLLGFSQGGATAIRFSYLYPNQINSLIVWGSDFPKELMGDYKVLASNVKKYFVLGKQDPFFPIDIQESVVKNMSQLGFENVHYEGKHKIDDKVLSLLIDQIKNGAM